ncbi:MAG: hypothetical protein WAV25_03165 [Minisyncoccia bacterium]
MTKNSLKIPPELRSKYGKTLVVAPSRNNRLFLLTPEEWEELKQILKKLDTGGDSSHDFYDFLSRGVEEITISDDDIIEIPDYLWEQMGSKGDVVFKIDVQITRE